MSVAADVVFASCLDLNFPGGVQRNLELLRGALTDSGCRVHVVNRSFLPTDAWKRSLLRRGWRLVFPSSEEVFRIRRAMREVATDLSRLPEGLPCIAFDAWSMIASVRAGWKTAFRTPTTSFAVEESFDNGFLSQRSPCALRFFETERAAVMKVDRLIALSARGGEVFAGYGVPRKRIRIIPNAIRPVEAPPERQTRKDGSLRLLWVGHLRPVKGLDVLIEALAALSASARNALQVAIAGSGAEEGNPAFDTARSGLERAGVRAEFLGLLDREAVRDRMLASDLFVLSSRRENFPNAVLEAMEAGLPVAATDVGAVPEMLGPASEGLVVPSGDAAGLADAIARLVAEPDLRRRAGEENRQRVEDRFSIPRMVESYLNLIEELDGSDAPLPSMTNPASPPPRAP